MPRPVSPRVAVCGNFVLRRDAVALSEIEFDYAILDEAQTAKNATTDTAKAVRLIKEAGSQAVQHDLTQLSGQAAPLR